MSDIRYKYYRAFGWLIAEAIRPDGCVFTVTVANDSTRTERPYITLYTQGELTHRCLTDDVPVLGRSPGTSTIDLNPLRAGTFEFTAHGDVHWWCIDRQNNKGELPDVEILRLSPGQSRVFDAGAKVLVCSGDAYVNGNRSVAPHVVRDNDTSFEVIAASQVYGFVFA